MWEWLVESVDPDRAHIITAGISWHGRIMVIAWGVLAPLAVLIARFAKILPWQKWPEELDNPTWWRSHWIIHTLVLLLTIGGTGIMFFDSDGGYLLHQALGYAILVFVGLQVLSGVLRGTKGGPTSPAKDGGWYGDHYNMTRWRSGFEMVHKTTGYVTLLLALLAIVSGMWAANAPNWMFAGLGTWWILLVTVCILLQRKGFAVETYQAVWGPDRKHPGNRMPPAGWLVRRPSEDFQTNGKE